MKKISFVLFGSLLAAGLSLAAEAESADERPCLKTSFLTVTPIGFFGIDGKPLVATFRL